jgi:hypothetical protein
MSGSNAQRQDNADKAPAEGRRAKGATCDWQGIKANGLKYGPLLSLFF